MRSCLGSILLLLLVIAIAVTAFYHWETNERIEFSVRDEDDPALQQKIEPIEAVIPKKKQPAPVVAGDVMKMETPAQEAPAPAAPVTPPETAPEAEPSAPAEPV